MKKLRKTLTAVVALSMIASYVYVPVAQAASLTNVSDTVSTSAPATSADHTFQFTTAVEIDDGGYIEITFDGVFGVVGSSQDIDCGTNGTSTSVGTNVVRCDYSPSSVAGAHTITVDNITNPATGFHNIDIDTYLADTSLQESANVIVAIVDTVTVTAHVDSTLTFNVAGVTADVNINGASTTAASTATTTPFGDIVPGSRYLVGQQLGVTTNASAGFTVTVTQNNPFQTAVGATIDSFVNGTATTTPTPWTAPSGDLADDATWGHLGVTTDDNDGLNGLTAYGSDEYTGLTVSSPTVVMAHNGPSSASAEDKGLSYVGYAVQINALQQAGDYETTLTYIATPTY